MIEELLQRRREIDAAHVQLWSEWTPELFKENTISRWTPQQKQFVARDFALLLRRIELIRDARREGCLEQVIPESIET